MVSWLLLFLLCTIKINFLQYTLLFHAFLILTILNTNKASSRGMLISLTRLKVFVISFKTGFSFLVNSALVTIRNKYVRLMKL